MSDNNAVENAWNEIVNEADSRDDATVEQVLEEDLADEVYHEMLNVARSAGLDLTGSPEKTELLEMMAEEHIFRSSEEPDEFHVESGGSFEKVELKEVQTPDSSGSGSSGPTDKTVLYCLTRAETTDERVAEIEEALGDAGYELRSTAGGDKYSIVLPAEEADEESEESKETESAEDAEESEESESSDSEGDEEGETEDAEESGEESEESDDDDDDDEAPDEAVPRDLARERLEDKTKNDLYEKATEQEIDGRSDMTKGELVDALLDAKDEVADE